MTLRGSIPGPAKASDRAYGVDFFMLTPWDRSFAPKRNDRIAKLGLGGGTRAVAIIGFDPETNKQSLADGWDHPLASRARLEPDNWVFLDHGGIDKVWAHRYVVDHENHSASIKHRSTIGVNQKGKMCWGYSQDLEWYVEIEEVGPPIPKGREFDGAGFIGSQSGGPRVGGAGFAAIGIGSPNSLMGVAGKLKEGGPLGMVPVKLTGITKAIKAADRKDVITESSQAAKPKRATRCLNNNQRGGYVTDGKLVYQLRQLFHCVPFEKPKPKKPEFEPVETESKFKSRNPGQGGAGGYGKHPGQIEDRFFSTQDQHLRDLASMKETVAIEQSGGPDGDCMVDRAMAALRGDVLFDVLGFASALAYSDIFPPEEGDPYAGAHWLGEPSSRGPKHVPAEDISSDQPILESPNAQKGIRVYVRIPRGTGTPPSCQINTDLDPTNGGFGSTGHVPPPGTDPGAWRPPLPFNDNGMTKYEFTAGFLTYVHERLPVPMGSPDMRLEILIPYTLPVNLAGGTQMDFRLFWKPSITAGDSFPTTWNEITKPILPGSNPASAEQLRWLRFEIPRVALAARGGGGQIDVWFMRRSDDSATGKAFLMAGDIHFAFAPFEGGKRYGLAGSA